MAMKKVLIAATDIRVFVSELVRLGSLGAVFTEDCIAIKGIPLSRATVLIDEDIDVGVSPNLTVYSEAQKDTKEKMESMQEVVETPPSKPARKTAKPAK